MNITLKSLKVNKAMSEETLCFSATICVDGKPVLDTYNHGHGGGDEYRPVRGKYKDNDAIEEAYRLCREWEAKLTAYAKEQGHGDFEPLSGLVNDLLVREEQRKALVRVLKKKIAISHGGSVVTFNSNLAPTEANFAKVKAHLVKQGKTAFVVLNELSVEDALDVWMKEVVK